MSTIRNGFHSFISSELLDNILFQRSNFYYFLGKVEPWEGVFTGEEINNTEFDDLEVRNNILYIRKVKPTEASLVTKSFSWESGVVFDQWDHTLEMKGQPFYCITDEFNVYKCLNNNNGAASTVKPTSKSLLAFTTADGYIWKYMYNVPSFKRNKFLSADYVPVQKALTDGFYNKGAVEQVVVVDGGSGYIDVPQTTITVGGPGTSAVLTPIVSKETGAILDVRIDNPGTGYVTAPTLTIVSSPSGNGIYGNASAVLEAVVYNGEIVNVVIKDPGENYPADTSTTITVIGDGTGASFSPVVSGGVIVDVVVENPGQDYTFLSLTVNSEDGSGAILNPILAASDFLSDQALIEQAAEPGAIYAIKVTNGGDNYDSNTTVIISGDGAGATAEAVIVGGSISQINVTQYGSGYTYADIIIYNPNRDLPNDYIDAVAYAILTPSGGHGYDAVNELYGDTLVLYTQIKDDEELINIGQDYHQYGIIVNPLNITDNKRVTSDKYFTFFDVNFNSTTNMTVDSVIISDGVRYRVVQISGLNVKLQQLSVTYKSISVSDVFYYEADPGTEYIISGIVSIPVVNKYSGDLIYTQNFEQFTPTNEELLAFRTYINL